MFQVLPAGRELGMTLTSAGQLIPEQSTATLLVHHKVSVVPLDMRFPDTTLVVLVSGPNAGGKTVVLKTVGLLALIVTGSAVLYLGADWAAGLKPSQFIRR